MKTENYDKELQENGGRRDGNVLVFIHQVRNSFELELRQRFAEPESMGDDRTYTAQWRVDIAPDMPYYAEVLAFAAIVGKDPDFQKDHPKYPTDDFEIPEAWEKEIRKWGKRNARL